MLTVDLTKRATIEQIKRHRWMKANLLEERYKFSKNNSFNLNLAAQKLDNNIKKKTKPHPQILKCMNNMNIETSKIQHVIFKKK